MALALLADVVYGGNIRMRKAGGGFGFLFKARKGFLVKAFALDDLNGYGAAEPGVLSLEDDTLAALSQLLCDLVPAAPTCSTCQRVDPAPWPSSPKRESEPAKA